MFYCKKNAVYAITDMIALSNFIQMSVSSVLVLKFYLKISCLKISFMLTLCLWMKIHVLSLSTKKRESTCSSSIWSNPNFNVCQVTPAVRSYKNNHLRNLEKRLLFKFYVIGLTLQCRHIIYFNNNFLFFICGKK